MSEDWGGLKTILDSRLPPADRVDCPVCGTVLTQNGSGRWSCPFGGFAHWDSMKLPRD